jgi:hypothetical protein
MRKTAGEHGQDKPRVAPRHGRRAGGIQVLSGPDQILTSREAREFLKIGRTKLHELTRRQLIPAYRIGTGRTSALRYLRSDLLGWLVRQKV